MSAIFVENFCSTYLNTNTVDELSYYAQILCNLWENYTIRYTIPQSIFSDVEGSWIWPLRAVRGQIQDGHQSTLSNVQMYLILVAENIYGTISN